MERVNGWRLYLDDDTNLWTLEDRWPSQVLDGEAVYTRQAIPFRVEAEARKFAQQHAPETMR